ncbi:hypothetical protein ACFLXE_00115 [Chloroflexota bacterium]
MATVAELVTFQIGMTEHDLLQTGSQIDYAALKASAISRAKADLYYGMTIPAEGSMSDLEKYYLADCAVVLIIDSAIDWYKSMARLSDTKEGATIAWYDKVDSLERLRRRLQKRINDVDEKVKMVASGGTASGHEGLPLAQAQDESRDKVTPDPQKVARVLYGDYAVINTAYPLPVYPDRPGEA